MPSAPPTVHTHLKQEVVCIVYCNDKIFQHPSLITNGGQQALPVDKEPHLQQLFQEEGVGHALEQLKDKACDDGGESLTEDDVSPVFI